MATSPRKPEFGLPLESQAPAAVPEKSRASTGEWSAPGRDALQALLAFSSLHEQIRQRRARDGQAAPGSVTYLSDESPDEFVLYEVLQLVTERALALTGADGVAIALVQESEIICRAASGPIAPDVDARLDPNSGFSGLCLRTGEVVRCDDASADPRVNWQASQRLNARSMVAVPLRGRRSVVGLLEAFSTEAYGFNDSDVRSLTLLAELILGAMKPEEEERLEELSPIKTEVQEPPEHSISSETEGTQPAPPPETVVPAPTAPEPAAADQSKVELVTPTLEPELVSPEVTPALLRNYGKPATGRPGLMVVVLLIAVGVLSAAGLWWGLHRSHTNPAWTSAAATPKLPAPASEAPSGSPETTVQASAGVPPESPVPPEDANRNVLPVVTGIRHWESGDSTTVVIDLQDRVQYEVHRLSSPERIYFDLHDTVLGTGLSGKTIEVGDVLLSRIRIAQPVPGVSRIVLETKNVSNFSVSLESNPFRLVAEIRAANAEGRAKPTMDFLKPYQGTNHSKLSLALEPAPMTKADLQLRAKVPKLRIVVDAGHGGWDLGTVGRKGLLEKDLVLDVAQRLGKLLASRLGSEVIYTRDDDTYIPLEQRTQIANQAQADLFVSVHANYSDYPSARGVETYYTNVSAPADSLEIEKRENATAKAAPATSLLTGVALKERSDESRRLAASVERALYGTLSAKNPGMRDRGVKEAGFVVLTGTSMPAILAEVSFVSSPSDEYNLQSFTYRQQIAEALYKGIARYAASTGHVKMARESGKPTGR